MEKVLQTWLNHQCRMLTGSIQAVLLTCPPDQGPTPRILYWPDDRRDPILLLRAAQEALRNRKTVVKPLRSPDENTAGLLDVLACPLFFKGQLQWVAAIAMTHRSPRRQLAAVQQVQTGAGWLEAMIELPLDPAWGSKKKDRQLFAKKILEPLQKMLGPRGLLLKAGVGLAAVLLLGIFMVSALFRVPSDSKPKAAIRHAIAAPRQSYVVITPVSSADPAGDSEEAPTGPGHIQITAPPVGSEEKTSSLTSTEPSDRESGLTEDHRILNSETETAADASIQELPSIEIGPIVEEQALMEAAGILHSNGFDSQQTSGVGTVKVTRLLEGIYPRGMAHKRFKAIQEVVDSAFMIPEGGKLAIYVATYRNRANAIQKMQQLAQKNIQVAMVGTELEMKGTMLVVKQVDPAHIETITDQMSKMGLSVKVIQSG